MSYAIARIRKLKRSNLAGSEQHVNRLRETPNANPERRNVRLVGEKEPTLEELVQQRIGAQSIRKNAVWCVEMLLTASPEYFRANTPGQASYWDEERLERFQWTVQQWLTETYGDRIVRAELHLDEATPHIHAYLVPLDERGKLNCRGLFGDRTKLRQFQDSYAKALEPLGIQRGIRGSRATHTAIQEYYAAVMQEPDFELDSAVIQHQLADRRRLLKERNELEQTARHLARENGQLQQRLEKLEKVQLDLDTQDLSLEEIAAELGLKPDARQAGQWRNDSQTISITGDRFYDWQTLEGGTGAIEFVMYLQQCDFRAAIVWLRDRWGDAATVQAVIRQTEEILQSQAKKLFVLPELGEHYRQEVKVFLTKTLKLPGTLVERLYQVGLLYPDQAGRVVFVHRSLNTQTANGATVYSIKQKTETVADGSWRRQGWFYLDSEGGIKRVVLVNSAIAVLAKFVFDQPVPSGVRYLAASRDDLAIVDKIRQSLPGAIVQDLRDHDWHRMLLDSLFRKMDSPLEENREQKRIVEPEID